MNHFWFANRLYKVIFFTFSLPCENETKTYISSDKEREEFRMRKFKKALAFALASAMIVSAVPASAAAKTNSAKGTKSTIYTYTVDKSKKANANNKRSWIKVTAKKGYTYKLVNKTKDVVSLTKTRVEAKKTGTAKINVNFYKNGKYVETKSVKITVKKAPMIGAVTLDKTEITAGETTKVSNAGKGTAYFYSSNKDVATVDKTTGEITAKAAGTTTISAVNTITKARVYLTLTVNAQFAAKQTGAKEITVTGSGFNADTKVEIKRGTATVDFDSKKMTVASDGKSIIIPTNSLISAAEYTVTAGDKTAKFTGEEAKVTTIDIGDVAVADGTLPVVDGSTSAKTATVGYTVKNQFGEDITKTTSLTASSSKTVKSVNNGEIQLNLNTYDKVGDEITVVLVYTQTGLSVTQKAILSNEAVASEVAVKGIYNENKKELTEDTANDGEVFYLLLDVKDQYGKNMAKKGFTVGPDMTYDLIVSVAAGTTNVKLDTNNVEIKTVDGKDYLALKIVKADSTDGKKILAGTASVLMITKSGKTFNGEIQIAAGTKVDTFTAAPADVVIGGQDNVFTFTATDTYGNDISEKVTKDMFSSNSQTVFGNGDNQFSFEKNAKTGKMELIFHAKSVEADTPYVASFITATNKPVTVQFTVRTKANPVNITGTKDISLGALKVANVTSGSAVSARTLDVKASDIKVENQYGSDYTFDKFDTVDANGYKLVIKDDSAKGVFTGAVDSSKEKFTLTVAEKGSEDCTVQLVNTKDNNKVVSEYTFTVYAKTMDELKNFTVDDMPTIYYKGDRALTVKGVAGDGVKVTLTAGEDYTVLGEIGAGNVVSAGAISTQFSGTAVKTVDSSYSVVINNEAGTAIDKTVKVSNAKKVATTATVDGTTVSGTTLDREKVLNTLTIKDQYGEEIKAADLTDARVAFSGYSDSAKVNKNNTANAEVTGLAAGEVVTAKVTFGGGYTFTTNVKMVK